ncbi:hypothetical protein QR680_016199 [Steinernema hermaphroditum]|uniref:Uncharacterized protein n=1 Tax=Steinernema hermaphroditum TaxID=289476 RepID=A0AA39LM78_9BILA|nr:hypothetical protein QR680_016199 [Steinernema hermaphroditum]
MTDWTAVNIYFSPGFHLSLTVLGTSNTVLCSFTIIIVFYNTPAKMRGYAALLLNILIWNFIGDVYHGLITQFEAIFPVPCMKLNGLAGFFKPSGDVTFALGIVYFTIWANSAVAAFLPLQFRYLKIAYGQKFSSVPKWVACGYCILMHSALSAIVIAAFYCSREEASVIKEALSAYPQVASRIQDSDACVKMNKSNEKLVYLITIVVCTLTISMFTLLALTIQLLNRQRNLISHKTYILQKALTKNLIIITLLPVLLMFTPGLILGFAFSKAQSYSTQLAKIAEIWICFHGMVVCCVTLLVYKAYRRGTLKCLRRCVNWMMSTLKAKANSRVGIGGGRRTPSMNTVHEKY